MSSEVKRETLTPSASAMLSNVENRGLFLLNEMFRAELVMPILSASSFCVIPCNLHNDFMLLLKFIIRISYNSVANVQILFKLWR